MLTSDDVRQAYRLFLGREPENEQVVTAFQHLPTLTALREAFITSDEFQLVAAPKRDAFKGRLLADASMSLDLDADDALMERMLAHIASQWKALGEESPYWSVLSSEQFRTESFEANREAFYQSGDADVQVMLAFLSRASRTIPSNARCFEFGCGVGRVTIPLSHHFREVVAFDISEPHLTIAKRTASEVGITNIQFESPHGSLDLSAYGKFNFIFSTIVLQHNPPPVIAHIIEAFCHMLTDGALAYFQVPTYSLQYNFNPEAYLVNANASNPIEMHVLPQRFIFETVYQQHCRVLEVREDNLVGHPGFVSNTFLIEKVAATPRPTRRTV